MTRNPVDPALMPGGSSGGAAALPAAVGLLGDPGARVEEADPPLGDVRDICDMHWQVGVFDGLVRAPASALKLLDPGLDAFVEKGRAYSLRAYIDAANARQALGQAMRELHARFDIFALPTVAVPAFPADRRAPPGIGLDAFCDWTPFSFPFNLTHRPALSVPSGLARAGLPIGLPPAGDIGAAAPLLRAGRACEAARGRLDIPLHPSLTTRLAWRRA